MEYVINQVPFEMRVIPEHLFNLQFLSDITFIVDGKQIYAHSLELMKRSIVFIKQLESTLGEKKLIPITDYGYDVFYQFVRFIYTDICDINAENCVSLLNLAQKYKLTGLVKAVQKYKKIDTGSNDVPQRMKELPAKFFNLQFLSDIKFIVEGKHIYAHSLELMKRSSVFQQQLESTMGEKKQISINDYGYNCFYQFIRFIYTDKCNISEENSFELLKLAIVYKIPSLINFVQNSFKFNDLELIDFCRLVNDNSALFGARSRLNQNLKEVFTSDAFLSARTDTVAEILKFDEIYEGTSEMNIIDALVRWMKHHCTQNKIQFSDCRQKFDKLIRLIRFPTLSNEELGVIESTIPDLLTESDFKIIGGQKIFGADYENVIWNCTPRFKLSTQFRFSSDYQPTSFSVGSELILAGLIIGKFFRGSFVPNTGWKYDEYGFKSVNIKISYRKSKKGEMTETLLNININNYNPQFRSNFYGNVINLGSSVRIHPGFTYTIESKYVDTNLPSKYKILKSSSGVPINTPPKLVQMDGIHQSSLAMYFLKPDGNAF